MEKKVTQKNERPSLRKSGPVKRTQKKENLLEAVERISHAARRSGLDPARMKTVAGDIRRLGRFLDLPVVETVLLSVIIELSLQKTVNLDALGKHFNLSPLRIYAHMDDLHDLVKRGFLHKEMNNAFLDRHSVEVQFKARPEILDILQGGDKERLQNLDDLDLPRFLEHFKHLLEARKQGVILTGTLISETDELIRKYRDKLEFVRFVDEQLTDTLNKMILFYLSYIFVRGDVSASISDIAEEIYEDFSDRFEFQQEAMTEKNELFTNHLVHISDEDFLSNDALVISDKVEEQLFKYHKVLRLRQIMTGKILEPGELTEQQLFFPPALQERLSLLEEAISPERYDHVTHELREHNFRTGLTVLLYGPPGTGKTEAVYQMARHAGREVMMVDLSSTRSKWFGESEKLTRQIFEDYRLLRRDKDSIPILFINEADGLFTRRNEIGGSNPAIQQAINTIQNILLQELEDFDGIFIATTNLTVNLDKAFDRRFLFKIRFDHPDASLRRQIWKSKYPKLPDARARTLAERYELTGGQIENVVRQTLLNSILKGEKDIFRKLEENCRMETLYGENPEMRIGFR